jgi:hypothetical protein
MRKKATFFLLIFFIAFIIYADINKEMVDKNENGSSVVFISTPSVLKVIAVNGFQVEIWGFWGHEPGFFKKLLPKAIKSMVYDSVIVIESQGNRMFHYKDLDAIINQIKGELRSLYSNGANFTGFKIKDKEK